MATRLCYGSDVIDRSRSLPANCSYEARLDPRLWKLLLGQRLSGEPGQDLTFQSNPASRSGSA